MRLEVHGAEGVAANLRGIDPKMIMMLRRRIDVASELLRERIIAGLVTGAWGIKSRRGTAGLAGTVHQIPAEVTEKGVEGGVRGAGAPAEYGAFFQTGGRGPYQIVGKPVLAWPAYGKFQKNTKQGKFAFTVEMLFAKRVTHPTIKRAPWMTGPFEAMMPEIMEILTPTDQQKELFES